MFWRHSYVTLMVVCLLVGVAGTASAADQFTDWQVAVLTSPGSVMALLNGTTPYTTPVAEAKVSAYKSGSTEYFRVFYRPGEPGDDSDNWAWKLSTTPTDVKNFLNGVAPYGDPINDPRICALWDVTYPRFYIFYKNNGEDYIGNSWNYAWSTSATTILNALNGASVPRGRAEMAAYYDGTYRRIYAFYKTADDGQARNLWTLEQFSTASAVVTDLNESWLPKPEMDAKQVIAMKVGATYEYYLFKPQGLVLVTRELSDLILRFITPAFWDWVELKRNMGFEVYLVKAEWIDLNLSGDDIRFKIRNCLRAYYDGDSVDAGRGVRFAMLVGDAVEPTFDPAPDCMDEYGEFIEECPVPVDPALVTGQMYLPAGFYRRACYDYRPQYGSLFWADLTDKVNYAQNESRRLGDYQINVGILPIRNYTHAINFFGNAVEHEPAREVHLVFSYDAPMSENILYQLMVYSYALSATPTVSFSLDIFDELDSTEDIEEALFEQDGVIFEHAHGSINGISVGGQGFTGSDASKFTQINAGYLFASCNIQAYQDSNNSCLMENWLLSASGSPSMSSLLIDNDGNPYSPIEEQYWEDLFAGKTIGEAFYGNAYMTDHNPSVVFGDPSLVLFGPNW